MRDQGALLQWAREHADAIENKMTFHRGDYGSYWAADDEESEAAVIAEAISALDFLRIYAGADSEWFRRASTLFEPPPERGETKADIARAVGDVLRRWADAVEAGVAEVIGGQVWGEARGASTDLMEQVRLLNEDRYAHPAAPIVLAGAAIEIKLRGLAEALQLSLTERPSMGAYYRAMRSAGRLTAQDVKDLDQVAGLRNSAAHGEFDDLSRERAGLMEQQVNLLLRRLDEIEP